MDEDAVMLSAYTYRYVAFVRSGPLVLLVPHVYPSESVP